MKTTNLNCEYEVFVDFDGEQIRKRFVDKKDAHLWLAEVLQREGSAQYEFSEILFAGGRFTSGDQQ